MVILPHRHFLSAKRMNKPVVYSVFIRRTTKSRTPPILDFSHHPSHLESAHPFHTTHNLNSESIHLTTVHSSAQRSYVIPDLSVCGVVNFHTSRRVSGCTINYILRGPFLLAGYSTQTVTLFMHTYQPYIPTFLALPYPHTTSTYYTRYVPTYLGISNVGSTVN